MLSKSVGDLFAHGTLRFDRRHLLADKMSSAVVGKYLSILTLPRSLSLLTGTPNTLLTPLWQTLTRHMADTVAHRASAGRATPLPSGNFDDTLQTVELLGLGVRPKTSEHSEKGGLAAAVARGAEGGEQSGDRSWDQSGERFARGMEALLERGCGPDSSWSCRTPEGDSSAGGSAGGDDGDGGDRGWRCFAGRMGREEAEALLRYMLSIVLLYFLLEQ